MKNFINIFFLYATLLPSFVFAQSLTEALVPNCGVDCNWTHFVEFMNNIMKLLVQLAVVGAGALLFYAAYIYITAQGKSDKIKEGHAVFRNAIIGLVIVLLAYLVVDTLLKILTGNGAQFWLDPNNN